MVAVLVSHDVPLRERTALRAELLGELREEGDIEVHLLVVWAIERSHGRLRHPARALDRVGEENGLRR